MIEADILIAGSGPTGTSAAWPLVKAGLSVVMVDAQGGELPLSPKAQISEWRFDPKHWRDYLGKDLGALAIDGDFSPKFRTPLGRAVIDAGERSQPALRVNNFRVARAATPGGLSSIWGAFCTAFDEEDMAGFPIGPSALAASYRTIAERIGINGELDDLTKFHGPYVASPPLPLTKPVEHLFNRYKKRGATDDFKLGRSRNAVLMRDQDNRSKCIQCGMCLFGCAHGSIYDARYELLELKKYPNFKYMADAPLHRIVSSGEDSVSVELQAEGQKVPAKAKKLILAMGAINSVALMVGYFNLFATRINLLNNPVAGGAFVVPQLIGTDFPQKTFGLGQLSYRQSLSNKDYVTGVVYGADTLALDVFARRMPLSRPLALRLSAALMPAMLLATCYLPGAYSANSMAVKRRDDGSSEVMIDGGMMPDAAALLKESGRKLGKYMGRVGAYPVPMSFTISPPGSDAHLAGTLPMGGAGQLSCSQDCEVSGTRGIFVVDGSWLPRLPAKHLTFTLMANADRVGRNLADTLRPGHS